MLDTKYDPKTVEPKIIQKWDDVGAFKAGSGAKEGAEPYCIVIPPPNVTGSLHMGHALNNTLQDIMIRFERMRGKDVLWQPGMDHAGIATQMVVERQLSQQKITRQELGREAFVERIWEWKAKSGGMIFEQLKRLGASCDWSREKFTMGAFASEAVKHNAADKEPSKAGDQMVDAVTYVFVSLYNEGLIYKDKRLVNWDPKLLTAISDLEVEQREIAGNLYYFRYPIEGAVFDAANPDTFITVATTRPETMLGDSGVAVHPEDTRYTHLVGTRVNLPIVGRLIPIIADDYCDMEKGTGAVKMTPAHDFNDFEVGKRHGLEQITVFTKSATVDFNALDGLHGLDRFEARKKIVAMMEEGGFVEKIEPYLHQVPHGDRSGVPIEPLLTDQWYVNAQELAEPAIASVREGRTKFVPENWEKTYFQWMENIQPWCISRQLWWGHQIPAWYGSDGTIFVGVTEENAYASAASHYGKTVELTRDPDVLDTWFSSALWPFSTLGWPHKTPELDKYYQTDVLVTGFDIIFFWVARMMMMGLHFMQEEPFHTVYVHALVRDKDGQKMSKSKGNVIDPLELIDEYGADALRFTLAIMAVQGRDVKLDPARIAGYRNFGTKLWNATRFAQINGMKRDDNFTPELAKLAVNRWIMSELTRVTHEITAAIETYRFNDAANAAYKFVWNNLCDWYLELLKPVFTGDNAQEKHESQATLAYILSETFKLLHPFMPFMSEELWELTAERETLLCHAPWPQLMFEDERAAGNINWLIDLVSAIRSVRSGMNVPPSITAPLIMVGTDDITVERLAHHEAAIKRLARVSEISQSEIVPKGCVQCVVHGVTGAIPLGSLIDLTAENARLSREIDKITVEMDKINAKLSNQRFVANARADVVELERTRLVELTVELEKMRLAIERLKDI
jgi:valyl-tRNA synthetase